MVARAYSDVLASWFQNYLDLEQAAELIRTYEVQFVPGLLQTEAYARAVISLGEPGGNPQDTDRRTQLRMVRQQVLDRPDAPQLWAVLDEALLRRPIGGPTVLRQQIESLLASCDHPKVRLQVIPFAKGGHSAAGGAFNILRFPHPDISDIVYIEHMTSSLYLEKPEDVDRYAIVMSRLFIEAEPPDHTQSILRHILRELGR